MTTIYDALAERLGRKPTHEETKAEVKRILSEVRIVPGVRSSKALHIQSIGRALRVQS